MTGGSKTRLCCPFYVMFLVRRRQPATASGDQFFRTRTRTAAFLAVRRVCGMQRNKTPGRGGDVNLPRSLSSDNGVCGVRTYPLVLSWSRCRYASHDTLKLRFVWCPFFLRSDAAEVGCGSWLSMHKPSASGALYCANGSWFVHIACVDAAVGGHGCVWWAGRLSWGTVLSSF